jgi:hypothetical protein
MHLHELVEEVDGVGEVAGDQMVDDLEDFLFHIGLHHCQHDHYLSVVGLHDEPPDLITDAGRRLELGLTFKSELLESQQSK